MSSTTQPIEPTPSEYSDARTTQHAGQHRRDFIFGLLAAAFLLIVWVLALLPSEVSRADVLTLGVLGIAAALICWTPLKRHLEIQENASMFVLTAAMFVLYSLADRAGPDDGWALTFPWLALPDDRFVVSYAARAVVLGAILTAPCWWKNIQGWTRALLAGAALLLVLAISSFWLLSRFYTVGPVEQLDPSPLPYLGMQLIQYLSLALLCNTAIAHPQVRRWCLRALPVLLLLAWARLQFFMADPVDVDGEMDGEVWEEDMIEGEVSEGEAIGEGEAIEETAAGEGEAQ